MLETDIEKYLRTKVKTDLRGLALKFVSPGCNGVPDRIILLPGAKVIFVETKAPKKNLRKLQEWICGKIRDLGFSVLKIDSKPGVDDFIRGVKAVGV